MAVGVVLGPARRGVGAAQPNAGCTCTPEHLPWRRCWPTATPAPPHCHLLGIRTGSAGAARHLRVTTTSNGPIEPLHTARPVRRRGHQGRGWARARATMSHMAVMTWDVVWAWCPCRRQEWVHPAGTPAARTRPRALQAIARRPLNTVAAHPTDPDTGAPEACVRLRNQDLRLAPDRAGRLPREPLRRHRPAQGSSSRRPVAGGCGEAAAVQADLSRITAVLGVVSGAGGSKAGCLGI